jgi:hypothetical protein
MPAIRATCHTDGKKETSVSYKILVKKKVKESTNADVDLTERVLGISNGFIRRDFRHKVKKIWNPYLIRGIS